MNKFFNHKTKTRGDNRELYKTSPLDIFKIVQSLLENKPELKDYIWIDPCAADGVWEEVITPLGIEMHSFDIKPLSNNVQQRDFLLSDFSDYKDKKLFFIGNPPYSMVKKFVDKALTLSDYCYFLGGSMRLTGVISEKIELLHRFENFEGNQKDRRSKLLFCTTEGEKVAVWTCGALFTNKTFDRFEQNNNKEGFAISPIIYCKEDKRIINIRR